MQRLLSEEDLRRGVDELAQRLTRDYAGKSLTVIGVLTGSAVFLTDLVRRIQLPHRIGWVQAKSYRGGATRPGALSLVADLLPDVSARDVLLVDDIFDTGHTLAALVPLVAARGAASVRSAVLLRKSDRRQVDLHPDYVAFEIPDRFVVGYGLDYQDAWRHLPYVAWLEPHELEAP